MTIPTRKSEFFVNNFDLVRLFAASSVAVGHISFWGMGQQFETTLWLIGYVPGVPIFFFVSGFLVSASWIRSRDPIVYCVNRALRIFPALWLALAFSITALLVLYRAPVAANLPTFAVWLLAQISVLQSWNPGFLRGYGVGVVNLALWTIPVELTFYVVTPFIVHLASRHPRGWLIQVALAALSFAVYYGASILLPTETATGLLLSKVLLLSPLSFLSWIWIFLTGCLAGRFIHLLMPLVRDRFVSWAALLAVVTIVSDYVPLPGILFHNGDRIGLINDLAWSMACLSFAYSFRNLATRLLRGNDYSYGVYLFHVPVLNVLLSLGFTGYALAGLSVMLVPLAAAISWHLVEKPAISQRGALSKWLTEKIEQRGMTGRAG